MARYEKAAPTEPFGRGGKLQVRRGPDGRMEIVQPQRDLRETTEAAERPTTPGDPRSGPMRDVPPFGAGA
jgi:hypothetical protein